MSNLPHLVTSLELSKRLKELGCKQDSLFYWDDHSDIGEGFIVTQEPDYTDAVSAYTAEELGEMLPKWYATYSDTIKDREVFICEQGDMTKPPYKFFEAETMADAMAEMLIFLLTYNLITLTK